MEGDINIDGGGRGREEERDTQRQIQILYSII